MFAFFCCCARILVDRKGPRGLADGLFAAEAMIKRGRADDAVVGLAVKHCIHAGDLVRAEALYVFAQQHIRDVTRLDRHVVVTSLCSECLDLFLCNSLFDRLHVTVKSSPVVDIVYLLSHRLALGAPIQQ